MELSVDRLVTIIAFMYGKNAEVVVDFSNDECYLFFDRFPQRDLPLYYEEITCLEYNGIIEFDSGCDEEGYKTSVYRLTEDSQHKIREIINDKRKLLLKLEDH